MFTNQVDIEKAFLMHHCEKDKCRYACFCNTLGLPFSQPFAFYLPQFLACQPRKKKKIKHYLPDQQCFLFFLRGKYILQRQSTEFIVHHHGDHHGSSAVINYHLPQIVNKAKFILVWIQLKQQPVFLFSECFIVMRIAAVMAEYFNR